MKVGFIGLGHMGAAMAGSLLQAGHDLTVYNRTPSRAQGLIDRRARLANRVANGCRGDAVITMLADDGAVESVVFGDGGALKSRSKGAIHVFMSTISVALSKRLTDAHAGAGQRLAAAPVFGRPDVAAAVTYTSSPRASLMLSPRASLSSRRWDRRPSTSVMFPERRIS